MPRGFRLSIAAVLALAVAPAVRAQDSRPERPYRGLFGGGEVQQGLTVSGSLGGGYDTDLARDARGARLVNVPATTLDGGGTMGQFSGSVSYVLSREAASLSASAGSSGRYYPSASERGILRREQASLQGSSTLGAGIRVAAGANYAPFRVSDVYPTPIVTGVGQASADFDFGSSAQHYLSYSGTIDGGWQISRRTRMGMDYRYGGRAASTDIPDHRSQRVGGNVRYNIGRGLDANLGYRYTKAGYASGSHTTHGLNAGVDFQRALSFSRRTTLAFSTGTTAFDDPTSGEGLRFRAVGSASLNHEIGRTWSLSASYNRNVRLSETWPDPVFTDAAGISLNGLVNRRFAVHSGAGASTGRGAARNSGSFDTYFADAGLSFAVGRHAAVGASYRYHHHQFAQTFTLAPGIGRFMDRHSAQVYVSVWAPIIARRP